MTKQQNTGAEPKTYKVDLTLDGYVGGVEIQATSREEAERLANAGKIVVDFNKHL